MLAAYTLGQGDICADDPCVSNLCPGYNAEICGELKTSPTTSGSGSGDIDFTVAEAGTCPNCTSWDDASQSCKTDWWNPTCWGTTTTTAAPPITAQVPGAKAAAALPMISGKTIGVLLAIAGVAGIGLFAYSKMKRAPKS